MPILHRHVGRYATSAAQLQPCGDGWMQALTNKRHIRIQLISLQGLLRADPTEQAHAALLATLRDCLPPIQQQRLSRLLRADDQLRHLTAHAALRLQLGQFLAMPPQAVPIRTLDNGKPVLDKATIDGRIQSPLHFNISHAGDWVALAWAHQPLGIDVESLHSARNAMPDVLAQCATPGEQAALARSSNPALAFLHLWTGKEAALKARGSGLSLPMDGFAIGDTEQGEWRNITTADNRLDTACLTAYRVHRITVDDHHAAAVAIAPDTAHTAEPHGEVAIQYIDAEDLIKTFGAKQQPSLWSLQA